MSHSNITKNLMLKSMYGDVTYFLKLVTLDRHYNRFYFIFVFTKKWCLCLILFNFIGLSQIRIFSLCELPFPEAGILVVRTTTDMVSINTDPVKQLWAFYSKPSSIRIMRYLRGPSTKHGNNCS